VEPHRLPAALRARGDALPREPAGRPGHRTVHLVGHSGATGSWAFHCPELALLTTGTVDQLRGRTLPFNLAIALRAACGRDAA
jgi:hypothetical protein